MRITEAQANAYLEAAALRRATTRVKLPSPVPTRPTLIQRLVRFVAGH